MGKIREKCFNATCKECDVFPLYMRGYDNVQKRVTKENEDRGKTIIRYGYVCPLCKAIIWRTKRY